LSTLLPGDVTPEDLLPISQADLIAYFQEGAKPVAHWKVGAEFEQFALNRRTGCPLKYAEPGGIRSILQALADRYEWEPHYEGGDLTTLSRDGATVSLEPGGQVEFSTPPVAKLPELKAEYTRYTNEIRSVVNPDEVAWVPAGVIPCCPVENIALGVRRRHAVMAEYLPEHGPMALHMMKGTASTQVAFDYSDEADAMKKFAVALTLGPVVNAIWANSPVYDGKTTEWVSYRGCIWQGMDPARSGLLVAQLQRGLSFQTWIDYLLDVPMLFHAIGGEFEHAHDCTFRSFMARGIGGHFPTRADWEVHLTTVFPEVRLKHFLEVRGADANPLPLALAVPALWKGLLYDADALDAAAAMAKRFHPEELPGMCESAYRRGLAATFHDKPLLHYACEIVAIASAGLRDSTGRAFLDPVREVLERGTSPGGAWVAECRGRKLELKELLDHFETR
jgi:glutamate--cysteine ligase